MLKYLIYLVEYCIPGDFSLFILNTSLPFIVLASADYCKNKVVSILSKLESAESDKFNLRVCNILYQIFFVFKVFNTFLLVSGYSFKISWQNSQNLSSL